MRFLKLEILEFRLGLEHQTHIFQKQISREKRFGLDWIHFLSLFIHVIRDQSIQSRKKI